MHIRTDVWRLSLLTALGLYPAACGGATTDESNGTGVNTAPGESETTAPGESETTAPGESETTGRGESETTGRGETAPAASEDVTTVFVPGRAGCGESAPLLVDGQPSGLEVCAKNGVVHRATRLEKTCGSELPRSQQLAYGGSQPDFCSFDADCLEKPHGYCIAGCPTGSFCLYGCVTDADCGAGTECVCGSPVGTCQASDCRDDSECVEGFLCAQRGASFRCQQPEDECAKDSDCPSSEQNGATFGGLCSVGDGALTCTLDIPVVCGRPFLVGGIARLAAIDPTPFGTTRVTANDTSVEQLDRAARTEVGRYWTDVALMEHASIAAFARFLLQLMHLDAPLPLLEAAQEALRDETEHAKACFEIATRFLAHPVGPGALPMDNALSETQLEEIVRLTIREGCIGETLAAMEAAEAAATCVDPHILSVLRRIQSDELRHAELAWRFVQWALTRVAAGAPREALETLVRDEFAAQATSSSTAHAAALRSSNSLAAYGVLPDATRLELRRLALRDVIAPCAARLLRGAVELEHTTIRQTNPGRPAPRRRPG